MQTLLFSIFLSTWSNYNREGVLLVCMRWTPCKKFMLTIFSLITSCTFARQVKSLSLRGIPSKIRDVKFSVTAKHSLMALQNSQSECLNCWSFINNETENVKINQWHKLISSKNWQFYKVFLIKGGLNILTVVQRSIKFISELAWKLKLKLQSAVELLDGVAMITWCTGKPKVVNDELEFVCSCRDQVTQYLI